ncbi:CDP-diacylglycerol--glycerol-3-phosphate 3-phosphatidyltransferase [bacterium BMS3Abin07]|nr:CDP-diacylglycerol--glycerol-3-phosphate 3-phosphatidyltransferase [bacterium BMS3Abin07]GBE32068.1 CDP-diacylglycerol--glycerol-3-phosphate 3-phosphatidyltransferase [bacterium BMS3Bbin05]HDL21196.1 CDP-diacylglycerol--glycerol-3-phosphate 3-phosphatidyltransferase [Nitrospirota bacterium]HDO21533.1 CDP-diacylglycerol--glycerol-3-phosphate 3-phosphatidyltransferase [Nitrospirota bacterium]
MLYKNLPNIVTLIRIILIPFFIAFLLYHYYHNALYTFIIAGLSDILDGYLARKLKSHTEIGKLLDPIADKFLLTASFIVFTIIGWIPVWFTIIVISRDIFITIGWVLRYLIYGTKSVQPSIIGKSAIALQMFLVGYILLNNILQEKLIGGEYLILIVAILTITSGIQYIYRGLTYSGE